jgi:hypothetical protein
MSGHLRFGFAAFSLVVGFATPAASNPFTDLFSPKAAPAAVAEAPAQEECLLQPGKSTAAGRHWVYRYEDHRKCWFQAEAGSALARKPAHRHAIRQRAAAAEENESAPPKEEVVGDAPAEVLNSALAEAPQPTSSALKIVHTVSVPMTGNTALIPPASTLARPGADQLAPDRPTRRPVDVESLLADASAASEEAASVPPATPAAVPSAETGGGGGRTPQLGVLLMVLGLAVLLSANRALRHALWPARFAEHCFRSSRSAAQTVSRSVGVASHRPRDERFRLQQGGHDDRATNAHYWPDKPRSAIGKSLIVLDPRLTLNQRVPGLSPGAPTKQSQAGSDGDAPRRAGHLQFCSRFEL